MFRKKILITGASSGLGYGMAVEFAKKGHDLALCARRLDRLKKIKIKLQKLAPNSRIEIKKLDVNDHEQVFIVIKKFEQILGGIDRIIINAGMGKGASIGTGHFHANKNTAETNFIAAIAQAEISMEIFRKQNSGHLVLISSISAVRGFRRAMTVYAASKAAITSLAAGIRIDVRKTPIKISCIHPGFIRTELNEKVKHVPFVVDLKTGCRSLVKSIEAEKANSFIPIWPWAWLHWLLRVLPDSVVAKFS